MKLNSLAAEKNELLRPGRKTSGAFLFVFKDETMTRKWIDYPADIQLETKLGTVYLTVTKREHIVVDASSNGRFIVVNNVEYHTRFHLLLSEDGSYQLDKNGIKGDRTHRYSTGNFWKDEMTSAAKKKVKQILIPLVNEWALSNPDILDKAEYAHVNNLICQLQNSVNSLSDDILAKQSELAETKADIEKLTVTLNNLQASLTS